MVAKQITICIIRASHSAGRAEKEGGEGSEKASPGLDFHGGFSRVFKRLSNRKKVENVVAKLTEMRIIRIPRLRPRWGVGQRSSAGRER